jgi:hypothetical protein
MVPQRRRARSNSPGNASTAASRASRRIGKRRWFTPGKLLARKEARHHTDAGLRRPAGPHLLLLASSAHTLLAGRRRATANGDGIDPTRAAHEAAPVGAGRPGREPGRLIQIQQSDPAGLASTSGRPRPPVRSHPRPPAIQPKAHERAPSNVSHCPIRLIDPDNDPSCSPETRQNAGTLRSRRGDSNPRPLHYE